MNDISESTKASQASAMDLQELEKKQPNDKVEYNENLDKIPSEYSRRALDDVKFKEEIRNFPNDQRYDQPISFQEKCKILEKCLDSRIPHNYSEFIIDDSKNVTSSSDGWFASREGVEFFIKPLNIYSNKEYAIQSFVTEVIVGPLYRLALFGKSPKIWLIKDDQGEVYLGSEFLPISLPLYHNLFFVM